MKTATPARVATSTAYSVLRQGRIEEIRKMHNPALHQATHSLRQNRANTVITMSALVILTLILGLLELHIRHLTPHSALLLPSVVKLARWRIDPRVKDVT